MLAEKNDFSMNLQFFSDDLGGEPTGVEDVPAAGEPGNEPINEPSNEPGVEDKGQAAAEPNNFEKAFAKRLSAERDKWQSEVSTKYGDYDKVKQAADYMLKQSGMQDFNKLYEAIQQEMLNERAQQHNVPPEVMKRLEELETKAQTAEKYEQEKMYEQAYKMFRADVEKAVEGTDIKADELDNFMKENDIGNINVALKALKADILEQKLASAEKDAMKKLINAKGSIPKVEGNKATGSTLPGTPKTLADARARAMERLNNWNQLEG